VRALKGAGQEDPATGSLNAGAARWLMDTGVAPQMYVAAQGTALGRAGRVHVRADDGEIWVGGDTTTVITGTVAL
jgi:predicted PhzF superfamily epimerase YddE/YHI9